MSSARSRKQQQDLAARIDQVKDQLSRLEQEIGKIRASGEVAPAGCWIVRFQAKGKGGGRYWYYKWQSHEKIFVTKSGQLSCHKYLGKAGSEAYLKAVAMVVRRSQIEGWQQAINTLQLGLLDLLEEASRDQKD